MTAEPPSSPAAVDLVVLDLDGTIVDLDVDWGHVRDELARIAREAGISPSGPGVAALLESVSLPRYAPVRAQMDGFITESELAGAGGPRNAALLEWLADLGDAVPVAVLSLNSNRAVARALERIGLDERVGVAFGREDVQHGKPDPQGLLELCARHAVEPERTLLVGDSPADRECAERAGARFMDVVEVGVRWERD